MQRAYEVDWRFISLRMLNANLDYASEFPAGYEESHTSGLRLLRVAARARADHGSRVVGPLYEAMSSEIFDAANAQSISPQMRITPEFVEDKLKQVGLPSSLGVALEDESWDEVIRAETDEALSLAGKDVGTPIIQFEPPGGAAFFGPVISRLPSEADSLRLWDHVVALAEFPGFAELKRSLRERPQLRSFGYDPSRPTESVEDDWHGGSRRQKK